MPSFEPAWVRGRDAAGALRLRLGMGFAPIDIWRTLEKLEIPLALHDFGEGGGDGLYLWEDERALIVINSALRPSRQRYTAAHELGHHEMHRHGTERTLFADTHVGAGTEDRLEKEAEAFAAYLLAPDETLHAWVSEHPGEVTPETVVALMGELGLSYLALTYRLQNAGVVNKQQADTLRALPSVEAQLRRAGIDEDAASSSPPPLPRDHVNGALRLYEQHVIGSARLAELLNTNEASAMELLAERGIARADQPLLDEDAAEQLLSET